MRAESVDTSRLTYEDYARLPEGGRYQLLEGDLIMTPAPTPRHQDVLASLYDLVKAFVQQRTLGKVYFAPIDVIFSGDTVLQPDLVFVSQDKQQLISERGIKGAPDLVVEISSPSSFHLDRGAKKSTYQQYGIPYLWLVTAEEHRVEEFELRAGRYVCVQDVQGINQFKPALFPDLTIELADLWA